MPIRVYRSPESSMPVLRCGMLLVCRPPATFFPALARSLPSCHHIRLPDLIWPSSAPQSSHTNGQLGFSTLYLFQTARPAPGFLPDTRQSRYMPHTKKQAGRVHTAPAIRSTLPQTTPTTVLSTSWRDWRARDSSGIVHSALISNMTGAYAIPTQSASAIPAQAPHMRRLWMLRAACIRRCPLQD